MIWHCYLDSLLLLASLQVSCIIDDFVSLLLLKSLLLLVSLRLLAVLLLTRHVICCRRLAVAGVCDHSVVLAMLLSTLLLLGVFCCCHPWSPSVAWILAVDYLPSVAGIVVEDPFFLAVLPIMAFLLLLASQCLLLSLLLLVSSLPLMAPLLLNILCTRLKGMVYIKPKS